MCVRKVDFLSLSTQTKCLNVYFMNVRTNLSLFHLFFSPSSHTHFYDFSSLAPLRQRRPQTKLSSFGDCEPPVGKVIFRLRMSKDADDVPPLFFSPLCTFFHFSTRPLGLSFPRLLSLRQSILNSPISLARKRYFLP